MSASANRNPTPLPDKLPMLIAKCPHCQKSIRVPEAPQTSQVQCPLCDASYPLEDVLVHLPPELIVRNDNLVHGAAKVTPNEESTSGKETIESSDFEDKLSMEPIHEQPQPARLQPFNFDVAERLPPTEVLPARNTVPRRKAKNPLLEVIKVGLGGLAGLAIAQLVLWWLPGSWSRDPLKLAPKMEAFAPWLLPGHLKKMAPVESLENTSTPPAAGLAHDNEPTDDKSDPFSDLNDESDPADLGNSTGDSGFAGNDPSEFNSNESIRELDRED